jgi:hypothetical protein
VAAIAVPKIPLVSVFVAAETGGHLGAKLGRLFVGDPDVAPDTISLHVGHV